MEDRISLTEYQKEFLSRIIAIPSIGGVPEEGAPYGRVSRVVLQTFLDEAKAKGFKTGVEGDQRTCYIADPKGNVIEIGSWNKPYEEKALRMMK